MITSVLGYVLASRWADAAGPRPPLAAGFAALVGGAVLAGIAPGIWAFVAARLLTGLGTGFVGVATYSLVSHLVPARDHAWIFGLINGAWLLPSLVGPLVAGTAAQVFGWRPVFHGVAVLTLLFAVVLWRAISGRDTDPGEHEPGPTRWFSGLVVSGALLALHLGGERADRAGILLSLLGLVATLVALRRLLPRGTYRAAPGAPRLIALRAILGATMAAAETYVPYYLQTHRGVTMTVSGLVMAGSAIGWGVGAMTQSRLAERLGSRRFLQVAALVGPLVPLLVVLVIITGAPYPLIAVALAVLGYGLGAAYPQISTLAFEQSPRHEHGSVGGALQLGDSAAGGAVLAVTGLVLAFGGSHGLELVYVVPIVLGLLGVVVASRATPAATGQASPGAGEVVPTPPPGM